MDITDIVAQLESTDGPLPKDALFAAGEQYEALRPLLLNMLRRAVVAPEDILPRYNGHLFAAFLAGWKRDGAFLEPLLDLCRLSDDEQSWFGDDFITGDFPRILASVSGTEWDRICRIVEDVSLDAFARGSALNSLLVRVLWGELERDRLVAYCTHFLDTMDDSDPLWDQIAPVLLYLHPRENMARIRDAFTKDKISSWIVALKNFEEADDKTIESVLQSSRTDPWHMPVADPVTEMEDWYCFSEEGYLELDEDDLDEIENFDSLEDLNLLNDLPDDSMDRLSAAAFPGHEIPEPLVAEEKAGRNDPCPCGSGKKFKKCCGR